MASFQSIASTGKRWGQAAWGGLSGAAGNAFSSPVAQNALKRGRHAAMLGAGMAGVSGVAEIINQRNTGSGAYDQQRIGRAVLMGGMAGAGLSASRIMNNRGVKWAQGRRRTGMYAGAAIGAGMGIANSRRGQEAYPATSGAIIGMGLGSVAGASPFAVNRAWNRLGSIGTTGVGGAVRDTVKRNVTDFIQATGQYSHDAAARSKAWAQGREIRGRGKAARASRRYYDAASPSQWDYTEAMAGFNLA